MELGKSASKGHLKFAPIKLIVIESRGEYWRTIFCAVAVGLSHVMIGATVMASCMYSLNVNDAHAGLCTLAYHFFTTQAILSLSFMNGWSAPFRLRHRKYAHIFLQLCSITCTGIGMASIFNTKGLTSSAHSTTGFVTVTFTLMSIITGPFGLVTVGKIKILHMSFGLPAFLMSSICLCCGFFTKEFRSWADDTIVYTLTLFVIFYTLCIFTTAVMKCMLRLKF